MITDVDSKYKDRIAIVTVGYNRLCGLRRLLNTLNDAHYSISDVPLIISIDASGDEELYSYVRSFEWKHGLKIVNIQEERLGLKKHLFQCFSLSKFFRGVIILEDDIVVSPYFYHYADAALDKYGNDPNVAGISLYRNEYDGYCNIPFVPMLSGADVFAWKSVCSWGELLNERMWNEFSTWLEKWDEDFSLVDMNDTIKGWTRAWSKYFYAYLVARNKYFIFPYESLTTNFNDAGGEHGGGESIVQVSLLQGKRNYQFFDFDKLIHYDIYGHNEEVSKWLNLSSNDLLVDFYVNSRKFNKRYILSSSQLPFKKIQGFALKMRPWELNIKYKILGDDIVLYDRESSQTVQAPSRQITYNNLSYFFCRYKKHFTPLFILKNYVNRIRQKLCL